MRTTKRSTAATTAKLNELIDEIVRLQQEQERLAEEIKAKREVVKAQMKEAKIMRHLTAIRSESLRIPTKSHGWNKEKLAHALGAEVDEYMPRTPKTKELRKRYDSDPAFRERVKGCFKWKNGERLEIRAPEDEEKEQAA